MNKPMIIYFVTKADEIVYIGQTRRSMEERRSGHINAARNEKGGVIGAAIRKHGIEAFTWTKHAVYYNQEDLDAAEKMLILKYKPKYNIAPGGKSAGWNKDYKETRPEVLEKISKAAKARKPYKRGPATQLATNARIEAKKRKMRLEAKPFICHQNNKTYWLKCDAAKDLNIDERGIVAVLCETHRMKSYLGYTFSYLN
jgi:group I intron endonuclease